MIKINLLPPHILEGRKVKGVAILMGLLVVACAVGMTLWVWAPAPFSLTSQLTAKKAELVEAKAQAEAVTANEAKTKLVVAKYAEKQGWVGFVTEADAYPEKWVKWFERINKWIPSEVVLSSLPLPSGSILTLQGTTSDYRAANRWWHSMMRSELVDPAAEASQAVRITPAMPEGPRGGPMAYPVTLTIQVAPEYVRFLSEPPAVPPGMGGGGGAGRGGGRMGGRGGGGGRMGGGMATMGGGS